MPETGGNIYFISDLHLSDGTKADRFRYPNELHALLTQIDRDPGATLVLLGDILELWACDLTHVLVAHAPLLRRMLNMTKAHPVYYVVGNHDALPPYAFLGVNAASLTVTERYTSPDGRLVAVHGHQYDPYNQVKPGADGTVEQPGSAVLMRGVGILERLLGEHVGDAVMAVGDWVENGTQALLQIKELSVREPPGQRGYPAGEDTYRRGARALAQGPVRWVVMGHTHHPEALPLGGGRTYVNIGSWVSEQYPPTYAQYDGQRLLLMDARANAPFAPAKDKPGPQ